MLVCFTFKAIQKPDSSYFELGLKCHNMKRKLEKGNVNLNKSVEIKKSMGLTETTHTNLTSLLF